MVTSSKLPFAVVAVEDVGVVGEMRLEDVQVAVEIVIADAYAHAGLFQSVFAERRAALECLLAECAIVLLRNSQLGVESHAT